MGKVPVVLRKNIAVNIKKCRCEKFPEWGGAKKCAEAFGVTPQQWSQWERGAHMPDEFRMIRLAGFFGVSTEWLRRDNRSGMTVARLSDKPNPARKGTYQAVPAFTAYRIDNGQEVPLRIEVERVIFTKGSVIGTERIF